MARLLRVMCGVEPHPVEGAVERALASRGSGEVMAEVGYGWDIHTGEQTTWSKAGLTAGFTSYVELSRDPKAGVIILSNRGRHRAIQGAVRTLLSEVTARRISLRGG